MVRIILLNSTRLAQMKSDLYIYRFIINKALPLSVQLENKTNTQMRKTILMLALLAGTCAAQAQTKAPVKKTTPATKPAAKPPASKYGALAIDRSNGFYYGWSNDYATRAEAEKRAVEECIKKGGDCTVVLTFSGTACAAYRTIDGKVGTAFGWGIAKTKEEADAIATREALKRSGGVQPTNFVWSCNSANATAIKEIYNASDEIAAPVTIGSQVWMNRNLDVSTFRNGDPIPHANTAEEWQKYAKAKQPASCYLKFDPANGKKYGKLYNFYAVMDKRGLAPNGWHVPSKREFEQLISFLGGEKEAALKIKSVKGWDTPDKYNYAPGNGNNASGLNLLPSGRAWDGEYDLDIFTDGPSVGAWYSSTHDPSTIFNGYALSFGRGGVAYLPSEYPTRGFAVRLVKN